MRDPKRVLGEREDVIPQARFEVILEFRQVEVRTAASRDELLRIVEEVEPEVDEGSGRVSDGLCKGLRIDYLKE